MYVGLNIAKMRKTFTNISTINVVALILFYCAKNFDLNILYFLVVALLAINSVLYVKVLLKYNNISEFRRSFSTYAQPLFIGFFIFYSLYMLNQ